MQLVKYQVLESYKIEYLELSIRSQESDDEGKLLYDFELMELKVLKRILWARYVSAEPEDFVFFEYLQDQPHSSDAQPFEDQSSLI